MSLFERIRPIQRIRPTVALAVLLLAVVAGWALHLQATEVASVAVTGIVAMGRDIIAGDDKADEPEAKKAV